MKDYSQYSGVTFLYLMDLLCKQCAAYTYLAVEKQVRPPPFLAASVSGRVQACAWEVPMGTCVL